MAKWLAKEFDWDTGRYTGRYYDIAEAGVVAVFVDSFYGDDASADPEDPDLPLKTLGAAITYLNTNGANGSRIFMNGIFSETLPTQTYWYEFIGCGGGKNGRVIWFKNLSTGVYCRPSKALSRYSNIETLNWAYDRLSGSTLATFYFNNCYLKKFSYNSYTTGNVPVFFDCLLNDYQVLKSGNNARIDLYNCISIGYIHTDNSAGFIHFIYGSNTFFSTSTTYNYLNTTNLVDSLIGVNLNGQFLNEADGDYNVRITSPLLGAGAIDEITGINKNIGNVSFGLKYNGLIFEFTTAGGATVTDLTIDATWKYTITAPATTGTLETALMDLGNIYPLENIDLFNVFDFLSGEITQGVFETFSSPRMALTIKLKYGLTSAEVDDCPWLLIEYGKQPTFSGTGASRVGNAADTFDPDTFQTITCRYMKLFVTLQNNS